MEHWIQIKDYNYEASSEGRIRNLDTKRVLKPAIHKNTGYQRVSLCTGFKKQTNFRVNRLVAEAFIENPYNKPYVHHKDGNKLNNKANNLEWVTAKENTKYAIDAGTFSINNNYNKQLLKSLEKIQNKYNFTLISELVDFLERETYASINN